MFVITTLVQGFTEEDPMVMLRGGSDVMGGSSSDETHAQPNS